MVFNSLQFLVFFIIVTIWYFLLPHKLRWFLLLAASCYFYMTFVPRYILILGVTIVVDYLAGIYLEKFSGKSRKYFLILSLVANIGVLVFFKYYNFLNFNLDTLLYVFHSSSPFDYLQIVLPIGLSFHTFQAMSYTIEVYRGNQKAEKHFGIYALYVMFYPQLVAGPIERPQNVLYQFHEKKFFNIEEFKSGLLQMCWGLLKKVVIADRIALVVDYAYENPDQQTGLSFLLVSCLYSFQIYCDFSGYSDIAIGASRTMGFHLMKNFDSPYLSTSLSEFWRRWHISLSTWFRDYLYIPLGGNRVSPHRAAFNLFITFFISGLWHGASWTFIAWGCIHGTLLIIESFFRKRYQVVDNHFIIKILKITGIFGVVTFAWIFFRSPSIDFAAQIILKILRLSIYDDPITNINSIEIIFTLVAITIILIKEGKYPLFNLKNNYIFFISFLLIILCCYVFGVFSNKQFIYFQF